MIQRSKSARCEVDDDPMGIYQKILSGKIVFPKFFDKNAKVPWRLKEMRFTGVAFHFSRFIRERVFRTSKCAIAAQQASSASSDGPR